MSVGWFEEYGCGCVSEVVSRKADLPGYCGRHGDDRRGVFRARGEMAVQVERGGPAS
ncbi:MAG: hypothetical protein K0S19_714 [Geminicoccaceae bacterium]|jgi:hypothetical protein|nr:hypothetical protein [Geminicoccaceae bacterium]